MPREIRFRPMKHKWASCASQGHLVFDIALLHQHAAFRAEAIAHKLLHLKIPNHGKLFKTTLKALLARERNG